MQMGSTDKAVWGSYFNTLAQSGTSQLPQLPIQVRGNGTDTTNNPALPKRAKRKTISNCMVLHLIDIAREKENTEIQKALWNTYHCQRRVFVTDGKMHGTYCKNRFCTGCLAIRKAEIIHKYLPVLNSWPDPFFLTLTMKAVKAHELEKRLDAMQKAIQTIIARYRKRHQRGNGVKLYGIKSLECNFNPIEKTYNPHFHLILPSLEIGDILLREWRLYWNDPKLCTKAGQHLKRIKDKEKQLIEIIKYGTKIFTPEDVKDKTKKGAPHYVYAAALYNIFVAMKGRRLFDRFGFDLPKELTQKTRVKKQVSQYTEYKFNPKLNDWIDPNTDKALTGYVLPYAIADLLNNRIDNKTG